MDEEDAVLGDDGVQAGELQGHQGGRAGRGGPLQESIHRAIPRPHQGDVHVSQDRVETVDL